MSASNPISNTVVRCYDILDATVVGGVEDLTEGKYLGNEDLPYEKAHENKAEWLLDKIGCKEGSVILDVGCGNGRLLQAAKDRGAHPVGITISPQQVARGIEKGLDVRLIDFRLVPEDWGGRFDGVIANGFIEHFVQVVDAANHRQEKIYKEMFETFHRILKPGGGLATAAIHWNKELMRRKS